MNQIEHGSTVTMHLSLSLTDGTQALSTFDGEPLQFTMGDDTLEEAMEYALFGLKAGDDQTLTLTPEQAYGFRDESLVQTLSKDEFPDSMQLATGQVIAFTTQEGENAQAVVRELTADQVVVDFNHPLAGKEVVYRVQILQVENT